MSREANWWDGLLSVCGGYLAVATACAACVYAGGGPFWRERPGVEAHPEYHRAVQRVQDLERENRVLRQEAFAGRCALAERDARIAELRLSLSGAVRDALADTPLCPGPADVPPADRIAPQALPVPTRP
jgi:hypothetical protein